MSVDEGDSRTVPTGAVGRWFWSLADRQPTRLLSIAIALNAAIATLSPSLGFLTLPRDTIEGYLWGRSLEWGYIKHPPLQAWILGLTEAVAPTATWLPYLYAQICVAIAFVAIWQMGRSMLGDKQGLLAALLTIVGVHTYSLPMANFTPDTLSLPLWALAGLFWWQAVGEGRHRSWLWLGLVIAVSVYAKYVVLVLAGVLAALTLLTPQGRASLKRPEPWIAVVIAVVLILPHLGWLVRSDFLPLHHATSGKVARGLPELGLFTLGLAGSMLWQHTGLLVLLALLLLPGRKDVPVEQTIERPVDVRFMRVSLIAMAFGPLAIALAAQIVSGNEFRHGRVMCMFAFSAIAALMLLGPRLELRRREMVAVIFMVLLVLLPIGNAAAPWVKVVTGGKLEPTVYPARAAAERLTALWREKAGAPLRIVAGERWHGGNVAMYSPDRPLIYLEGSMVQSPWITPELLRDQGALVVWSQQDHSGMPPYLAALGPFGESGEITLPWVPGYGRMLVLGYAIKNPVVKH